MASLTDAEEALRSNSAKANFQRLTRLLMCGGVKLLREKFDCIHLPRDLPLKLSDPATENQLKKAKLTPPERKCLYPSPGVYGKSSDFDITLIFRLLRTICNMVPPAGTGWDELPVDTDQSLEADLVRIKYFRNGLYGHSKTMEIPDEEFHNLWSEIRGILLRISASISHEKREEWAKSIDKFLCDALTPEEERYAEDLRLWYEKDMDLKRTVSTGITDLKQSNENIQQEVRGLREDLRQYQRTTGQLQITFNVSLYRFNLKRKRGS